MQVGHNFADQLEPMGHLGDFLRTTNHRDLMITPNKYWIHLSPVGSTCFCPLESQSQMCLAGQISGLPFTGEHLSSISSLPLPGIVLEWVFILRTYFIREIAKTENRKETTMETNRFSFLERKWVYIGMPHSWNNLNVERIREKWFFQFTKKMFSQVSEWKFKPSPSNFFVWYSELIFA